MAAPVTQTDIVNAAAALLGSSERITSLDGAGNLANHARANWDLTIRALFEDHPWNFAIERAALNLSAAATGDGFAYKAAKPANCLRVLSLADEDGDDTDDDYVVESDYILTDWEGSAYVRFISDRIINDCGRWRPLFAKAASYVLAEPLCEALTGSSSLDQRVVDKGLYWMRRAKRVDGLESQRKNRRGVTSRGRWGRAMRGPYSQYCD